MKERVAVRLGEIRVARGDGILQAVGLGSCVAAILYDPREKVGGLAHIMLPVELRTRRPAPVGRYATTAIPQLIEEMLSLGAGRRGMYARLVGGAAMFDSILAEDGPALGTRNIHAVRAALADASIPIRGEAVGGNFGRTVHFHISDGRVIVSAVRHPDVSL